MNGILGRDERMPSYDEPLSMLAGKNVLVTGAAGSIGQLLVPTLLLNASFTTPTDIDEMDVRDAEEVAYVIGDKQPDYIFHLAGAKHAPAGEEDPLEAVRTNTLGTHNVLTYAGGAKVVTASTCKSCNPETAYGASKLIAERMTLNAEGSVARFFNVVETQGNVFELWAALAPDEPIPVTPCTRYFISIREAVGLLLWAAILPSARYSHDPFCRAFTMEEVARLLYPDREIVFIQPRRGDRMVEPRCARDETVHRLDCGLWRIESQHDCAPAWKE